MSTIEGIIVFYNQNEIKKVKFQVKVTQRHIHFFKIKLNQEFPFSKTKENGIVGETYLEKRRSTTQIITNMRARPARTPIIAGSTVD